MAIKNKLRQGNLNPSSVNGLTIEVSSDGNDLVFKDTNIDYSPYNSIPNAKKKFILTDNNINSGTITQNMVYNSTNSEVSSTQWTYEGFQDGWYTPHIFYTAGYNDTLTGVTLVTGIIIYFNNTTNTAVNVSTGFYVYTGSNTTFTGSIQKTNTNFKEAGFNDWINYASIIQSRSGSWHGEYGMQQTLVISKTITCKEDLLVKTISTDYNKDCDSCKLNDYNRLDMKLEAADIRFCQEEFKEAQKLIEGAICICEENDCETC